MRSLFSMGFAVALLAVGALRATAVEQTITPIVPAEEQEIVPIGHEAVAGQAVDTIDGADLADVQQVAAYEPPSPAAKAATAAGKVALTVAATGIALAASAAMLLLL